MAAAHADNQRDIAQQQNGDMPGEDQPENPDEGLPDQYGTQEEPPLPQEAEMDRNDEELGGEDLQGRDGDDERAPWEQENSDPTDDAPDPGAEGETDGDPNGDLNDEAMEQAAEDAR